MVADALELAETLRAIVHDEIAALTHREPDPWLEIDSAAAYLDTSVDALQAARKRDKSFGHKSANGRIVFRRSELDAFAVARDDE